MAAAYSSEPWHELFLGVAGAAAALTGLLFVSLSINLQHILSAAWLPRRAALTLVLLFETLVIAILGLAPGQSSTTLGVQLLGVGGAVWLFATGVFTFRRPAIDYRQAIVVNAVAAQVATLPVIVAGASLVARRGGGLYLLLPAIILLLGVGVIYAWVLLVEIMR
jgi:modulator of FtsH protease